MAFMKFSKGKLIYSIPNGLGEGAYFDGSSYAQIANVDSLPYGGVPRSFSIWVYPTYLNNNSQHYLFAYGSSSSANLNIKIVYGSRIYFGGWQYDYPFQINKLYHIVITYDENKEFKIYCNKELIANRQNWSTDTPKGFAFIGGWYSDSLSYPFYGNLSNFQVFNRALSADEVTALYNKQEITNGRVLHIPLQYGKDDESLFSSKNFVYDYSILTTSSGFDEWGYPIKYDIASECGISYATIPTDNLILYMALNENRTSPKVVDSDVFSTSYSGNYDSANYKTVDNIPCLYLDSSSNVSLKRVATKTIRQATLSYWGKYTDSSQCIVTNSLNSSGHVNGGAEFWLAFSPEGAYFTSGNSAGNIITANMSISADWHHIAVTWDMDTNYMYLYLDGVLVGECVDQSWLAPNFNVANFVLSVNNLYRASSVIYGNGYYSSVRMYDRVLKASEIKALAREF
jgi:hypothetical protein